MTPEQEHLFIQIAQMGVACGCEHRYEWLMNYLMHLPNLLEYSRIPDARQVAIAAFLAFEQGTASCPEEEEELQQLDENGFVDRVNRFFDRH